MILKVKDFQNACKSILEAVDTTTTSLINETLELKGSQGKLTLNVTNREYYVSVVLDTVDSDEFNATVDAKLFLSLISKITTDEIELSIVGNALVIKANGTYKLPMIYTDGELLELTPITIDVVTSEFNIDSNILLSILTYNSKILNKSSSVDPKQKMCYIDELGAITFNTGACVNNFTLSQPIKILINSKLMKLFKLFAKDVDVKFTLGVEEVNGVLKTKVSFETSNISITSVLVNDDLKVGVPVKAIRGIADNTYANVINVDRTSLLEVIERLSLFPSGTLGKAKFYYKFDFNTNDLTVSDMAGENKEVLPYINTSIETPYSTILDLDELKTTLEGCQEQYLTMYFGDGRAVVVARDNVKNILPEIHQ